jgi:uncharacterized membrane protein
MTIIAYCILTLGVFIALLNAWLAIQYWIFRKSNRSTSSIPVIGGMLAAAGMLLSSDTKMETLFWLPLLLDIGCIPMLTLALIRLVISRY